MNYIICHYHEIGLKGKNRRFFEQKLVENIKRVLDPQWFSFSKRISGRIIIKLTAEGLKKQKEITSALKKVFGLANFSFAESYFQEISAISKKALEILGKQKFKTFKISTKRSQKDFPLTSPEVNQKVGQNISKNLKKKVDLENPEITCFIEIVDNFTFLYLEKIPGAGGLPSGASGKAISLISGGIDSPVASYQVMKRGVKLIFVHFHSVPYTNQASIRKVQKIVKILNQFQGPSKIYLVPFAEIQKEILLNSPAKLRVILYRRMMIKIAQKIAQKEKALAIVSGESVGQVASQTLENIKVIQEVTKLPIFRPLIGQDKQDIINQAKALGTYEISILPHQDCCARFLPTHPETRGKLKEIKKAEKKLNIKNLIKSTLGKIKVEEVS